MPPLYSCSSRPPPPLISSSSTSSSSCSNSSSTSSYSSSVLSSPASPPPSSARQPWGIAADNQCSWLEDCWTFVSHCPPFRPPQNHVYGRIELDSFVNLSINRLKLNPSTLHNWVRLLNLLHLCSAHFITSKDLAFWSIVFRLESYCVCMWLRKHINCPKQRVPTLTFIMFLRHYGFTCKVSSPTIYFRSHINYWVHSSVLAWVSFKVRLGIIFLSETTKRLCFYI